MDTNFDNILDKLVKIQELIDRGATAGEIAAATGRMQLLLTKHNLDLAMVAERKGIKRLAPQKFRIEAPVTGWRSRLVEGVTRANYAQYILMHTHYGVVCHAEDWETIQDLFFKFEKMLDKMAPIHYEQYKRQAQIDFDERYPEDHPYRQGGRSFGPYFTPKRQWCAGWRYGAAEGITSALMEARREGEQAVEGSSALVVVKTEAVNAAYDFYYPSRMTVRSSTPSYGRAAGYATGTQLAANVRIG